MKVQWTMRRRRVAIVVGTTVAMLAGTTALISVLQGPLDVPNASAVYLLAVVVDAVAFGTVAATATSVAAFLLFDFLFVQPIYTFTVADPGEWLNLVLLLLIGVVVGRLAAGQRNRAEAAELREREARVLFQVSRALAIRQSTGTALATIVDVLRRETGMARVWIALGPDTGGDRVTADSDAGPRPAPPASYAVLVRTPGEQPAKWIRVHEAGRRAAVRDQDAYRVNIDVDGRAIGALWSLGPRSSEVPTVEQTRMLSAAADQVGQAVEHDRLRAEATSAYLARRSDALKTALLDSVSHDLRTPLSTIRAAAGGLMDPDVHWSAEERQASARTIDNEAERLNRLVTNLLDLSRIEAGELHAEAEPYQVEDLVETTLRRLAPSMEGRPVRLRLPADLPLVLVDATFMDEILANVLENALKYAPPPASIELSADVAPDRRSIRLVIEDGGPGVPDDTLPRLFEKFYRVPRAGEGARRGTGAGLAVVRGLVEAFGGRVVARRSSLGGLAMVIDLPVAVPHSPAESSARPTAATSDQGRPSAHAAPTDEGASADGAAISSGHSAAVASGESAPDETSQSATPGPSRLSRA